MKQRFLNQLIKLQKIQRAKVEEMTPVQIKDYILNGTVPKNDKVLEIANKHKNLLNNMVENKLLPSMPCPDWIARHGTKSQPENYDVNLDNGITYGPYKGEGEIDDSQKTAFDLANEIYKSNETAPVYSTAWNPPKGE